MSIMKELWTLEIADPQVKTTYQYVLDLRERLEWTAALARENLKKAQRRQEKYFNRTARARTLKVGNKVLVLCQQTRKSCYCSGRVLSSSRRK